MYALCVRWFVISGLSFTLYYYCSRELIMWIHLINLASDAWKRFSHDTNCRLNFHCVFLLFNMGASDNAWIKSWPAGGGRKWQWQLLTAVWGCCCLRLTNIFFVGISDKARQHIKKPVTTEKVFSSCGYFSRPGCKYCVTLYFPPNRQTATPLPPWRWTCIRRKTSSGSSSKCSTRGSMTGSSLQRTTGIR